MSYLLGVESSKESRSYVARLGAAGRGLLGGVSLGLIDYADDDGLSPQLGADAGVSISLGASGRVLFCPLLGVAYSKLPSHDPVGRSSGPSVVTGSGALAFGVVVGDDAGIQFVPFGSVGLVQEMSLNAGRDMSIPIGGAPASPPIGDDAYAIAAVGIGIAATPGLLIRPLVRFPIGSDVLGNRPIVGVGVSILVGRG